MVTSYFKEKKIRLYGTALKKLYREVWERDNWTWLNPQCCGGTSLEKAPHHLILKSQGGEDVIENLYTLCIDCHKIIHRIVKREDMNKALILEQFLFKMQKDLYGKGKNK